MDPAELARKLWSLGEYELVAERLAPAAQVLVEATGVTAGTRVLDVAAGTGNVTLAAAGRGAHVTASDIAPAMVQKGRARTQQLGLEVEWHEADAQALPFADGEFDVVLSAFGAMFAPDPVAAAGEMLRVGGTVAMTTWGTAGIQGACSDVIAAELPDAAQQRVVPERWGDPEVAQAHFAAHGAQVEIEPRTLHWVFASPEAWIEFWERGAPPVVAARSRIGDERWAQLRPRLLDVAREHGATTDEGFVVEPPYLLIVARR
jgi:ubiquinone/menaquinone biosynthesis C-methylase UbiE